MRLIDVKTLELKEFHHDIPPYAILSHTWGDEELTFQEYLLATGPDANKHPHIKRKQGFLKIFGACKQARSEGLAYLWCDTNCIDKKSSAELSEAINSMYAWYRDSAVCYALLTDVGVDIGGSPGAFKDSRWFTRGWTLQELLAPEKVVFFDEHWNILGNRAKLAQAISEVTRIHIGVLHNRNTVLEYSIAQRMSWAAERQTTRPEDIAYCLLGIFDINMPLLYGERDKAFIRLQEEIIKVSDDQSILAWEPRNNQQQTSIFARSPNEFYFCDSITRDPEIEREPFALTNVGLSVKLPTIKSAIGGLVLAGLNCSRELLGRSLNRDGQLVRRATIRAHTWIWLRVGAQDIYERVHLSSSCVFLAHSFVDAIKFSNKNMFIEVKLTSFASLPPISIASRFQRRNNNTSSAGFHLTVGFGRVRSQTHSLETAYPPSNWFAATLRPRGLSCVSHEIISSGSFSVMLSIAWDQEANPIKWHYTSFHDPYLQSKVQLRERQSWGFHFEDREILGHSANIDPTTEMMSAHRHIQSVGVTSSVLDPQPPVPFVMMERESLHDHHGHPGVAVQIIFQEPPGTKRFAI
ncbi:HET-domain-containing protein [Xylaria grammica]|nr:HET-domain-containing protein [Xylaria grammica]